MVTVDVTAVEGVVRGELGQFDSGADAGCRREHLPPRRAALEQGDEYSEREEDGDVHHCVLDLVLIERDQREVRHVWFFAARGEQVDREDGVGEDASGVGRYRGCDQDAGPFEGRSLVEDEEQNDEDHHTERNRYGKDGNFPEGP